MVKGEWGVGVWGLGIGDWELGIGVWAQGAMPTRVSRSRSLHAAHL